MEVIAGDEQGPFRLVSNEGTKYNVKFVEKYSGYMKMFHVPDIKDDTLLNSFRPWLTRMENKTGITAKFFECDQSFDGPFLNFLEEKGITKLKGEEYEYHFPGIVENGNLNIVRHSSSMLIASKLPKKFYSDAQSTAVYLHNRIVHGERELTPFEMVFGEKPSLKHLRLFGCHGFVLLKKEWRDHKLKLGKLEPRAVKCRLLGYGDDDDTEEMAGYKVLVTHDWNNVLLNDPYVVYSKHCEWDESEPMTPLSSTPNHCPASEEDLDLGDTTSEYQPSLVESSSEDGEPESDNESFVALSSEEIKDMTNIVHELYKDLFNTDRSCGIDPETLMYAFLAITDGIPTPLTYEQAISGPESSQWKSAMAAEYGKLQDLGTYELEYIDEKSNVVKCKWVYKKKLDVKGRVLEYKARLVAKGFTQKYGIDFYETFAPVAKIKSIRALTQICASLNLKMYQDDAPSAFLNPLLKERVIMSQIPGFEDGTARLCVLKKTLYGLKQSPREWNQVMDEFLKKEGFNPINADSCIYIKRMGKELLLVAVYVDDIITCGKENEALRQFRASMHMRFNMKPGGLLSLYLGCLFEFHEDGSISMNQNHYLQRKISEFSQFIGAGSRSSPLPNNYQELLDDTVDPSIIPSTVFPYREMVGSLMYAMVSSRPDLAQSLSIVSRYLSKPNVNHCNLVRHIYQYVRGNMDYGIIFHPTVDLTLVGYVDAAYGNNFECSSTSGYCFTLGGAVVSWYSKAQSVTALSAAEAEYIAATEATKEAIWWRQFLQELGFPQNTTVLHEDNQACILLSKNPQSHSRTKHIQIRYHFIREKVLSEEVSLQYVKTKDQLADMFTKNLAGFKLRPTMLNLGCISSEVKGRIRN